MPCVQLLIVMLECGPTLHVTIPLLLNNRRVKGERQCQSTSLCDIAYVNICTSGAFNSSKHLIQQLNIVLLSPVMTYPAESVQIGYQNHVEDIRSFLDSRHADHYTVFNLSQRNYRGAKFSNRVSVMLRIKNYYFAPRCSWLLRHFHSPNYTNTRVRYEDWLPKF